jgi:hypothetical protein
MAVTTLITTTEKTCRIGNNNIFSVMDSIFAREDLRNAKRVLIKIGTTGA